MNDARAVIFDLDGVLADTARAHYKAWRILADELGIHFNEAINERLKGVDRMASLEIVLERGVRQYSADEKRQLAARKNEFYREIIKDLTPDDLLPGAVEVLRACRQAGFRTALASASRNAPPLIANFGITPLLDYIADANAVIHAKPDPEIFLMAAAGLGVDPADCIGVEDAAAGVAAIKAAGMFAVGIGDRLYLPGADVVLPTIADFDPNAIAKLRMSGG